MRLLRITLQDFRNVALADLPLNGTQHFFLGENGQGKTSLLEASSFITALRSFRTTETKALIAHGKSQAALACEIEHEKFGTTKIVITLKAGGKEVMCDGEKVSRLGDFIGRFPTVVFSSQDQQLVRGQPAGRRRWLDLTLAAMDHDYLRALQKYHHALAARNGLLKIGAWTDEIDSFERPLATAAAELVKKRKRCTVGLGVFVENAYRQISGNSEHAEMVYQPEDGSETPEAWRALFEKNRERDFSMKTTTVGPHRDDFDLKLDGREAKEFGSEGQQRTLALALKLAQVNFFRERSGVEPVLLADDVLGELDPSRRRRFWAGLGAQRQIIATGTSLPDAELGTWEIFQVAAGRFAPAQVSEGVK